MTFSASRGLGQPLYTSIARSYIVTASIASHPINHKIKMTDLETRVAGGGREKNPLSCLLIFLTHTQLSGCQAVLAVGFPSSKSTLFLY